MNRELRSFAWPPLFYPSGFGSSLWSLRRVKGTGLSWLGRSQGRFKGICSGCSCTVLLFVISPLPTSRGTRAADAVTPPARKPLLPVGPHAAVRPPPSSPRSHVPRFVPLYPPRGHPERGRRGEGGQAEGTPARGTAGDCGRETQRCGGRRFSAALLSCSTHSSHFGVYAYFGVYPLQEGELG